MGMQEREMLTNPKEGTDDTVVDPVNLSMLYLAITLLKPSASKRSPNLSLYRNNSKFTKEEHEWKQLDWAQCVYLYFKIANE